MAIIDDSKRISSEDIKKIFTNVISKNAEKAVNQAKYDRTILATIQYCVNASIGQYKIKYQNGYYTAYTKGEDGFTYSNGTSVFVLVPENNFNNKLFITGSATNYNGDKIYLSNMSADQQYKIKAPNIITDGPMTTERDINLNSYDCSTQIDDEDAPSPQESVKYYYSTANASTDNILAFDEKGLDSFKRFSCFKLCVSFKTEFLESRKNSGDYGIRLVLRYKKSETEYDLKTYEINTFMMSGAPFDFNDYVPQYAYWELDNMENFDGIEELSGFVRNFPIVSQEDAPDVSYRDIFVKDIGIYPAIKLYEDSQYAYKVNIISDNSYFTFDDETTTIDCTAQFIINGEILEDNAVQGLKYYWGKQDSTVDSVSNSRYNSVLGEGWYCLNKCRKKVSDATTVAELKQSSIEDIDQDQILDATSDEIEWDTTTKSITLKKSLFQGKVSKIKCVIEYGGTNYTSELQEIINPAGLYILVGSQGGKVAGQNGLGYFTIAAGVFQDRTEPEPGEDKPTPDSSLTLNENITYHWTETKNGITRDLPFKSAKDILIPYVPQNPEDPVEWDVTQDNELISDEQVDNYLGDNNELRFCKERYDYYNNQYTYYINIKEEDRDPDHWEDYCNTCKKRKDGIISGKIDYINNRFDSTITNELGYYILGPSDVNAVYDGEYSYVSARINQVNPHDTPETRVEDVYNTLYKLPVKNIYDEATYTVSAVRHNPSTGTSYEIGSTSIILVNEEGNTLDYSLQIVNGIQTYMYDERGISPSSSMVTQPIIPQPLYFILTNRSGEVLYDSSNPNDYSLDIGELSPVWKFYDSTYSFILTNYTGNENSTASRSQEDSNLWLLENEPFFYYNLRENYAPAYRNNSNIELQVTFDGNVIFATTSLTFAKQGDLGTNGTDRVLAISSDVYNNYKSNVLSNDKYNWIRPFDTTDDDVKKMQYVGPDQRHLMQPYLFATDAYSSTTLENNELTSFASVKDGRYVNLHIAQSAQTTEDTVEDGIGIQENDSATYQVKWYPADYNASLEDAKWEIANSAEDLAPKTIGEDVYYYEPSINLTSSTGNNISVQVERVSSGASLSYKPSPIDDYTRTIDGVEGTRIGNNIIQVKADRAVTSQDGATRTSYAFCTLPYFYFNWTYNNGSNPTRMPQNVDPARHILISGGFDQVVYDSAGQNPAYNNMSPFQFFMIDKDGNNITNDVLAAAKRGEATIEWKCSNGLRKKGLTTQQLSNLPDYTDQDFPVNEDLEGKLCQYQGSYYKCIIGHTKGTTHMVNGVTYLTNAFVYPYWEEIDSSIYAQSVYFEPADTFESAMTNDLFNSWIYLYVKYSIYEAEVLLPINIYCNTFEDPALNQWNGKKLKIDEGEDGNSYIIANKVSAGIKDENNSFVGISIGQNLRYDSNNTAVQSVGLFGYGYGDKLKNLTPTIDPPRAVQTMFLDAESGRAAFGPSGANQIILDPNPEKWSRLGGWYFSKNFLYKPVCTDGTDESFSYTKVKNGDVIKPPSPTARQGERYGNTFGIYVPRDELVSPDTIALWAGHTRDLTNAIGDSSFANTAEFRVTYGGKLYATEAVITGSISAKDGHFSNTVASIDINKDVTTVNGELRHYILYNPKFGVYTTDSSDDAHVEVKGTIEAYDGIIGTGVNPTDLDTMWLMRKYFDWILPEEGQAWIDGTTYCLDTAHGQKTDYILYHNNFSITKEGKVRLDGDIFARGGRVGGWVIKQDRLKAYTGNVELNCDGNATFGALSIGADGSLTGPTWSISSTGISKFTNPANEITASKYTLGNGAGGFDSNGLHIPTGGAMTIGDSGGSLHAFGGGGFEFTGPGCSFNVTSYVNFSSNIRMDDGKSLGWPNSNVSLGSPGLFLGQNVAYFKNNGELKFYTMVNGSSSFTVNRTGDVTAHDVSVNSLTINGTSLETYIKNIINDINLSYSTDNAMKSDGSGSIKVVTSVTLTKPSTT